MNVIIVEDEKPARDNLIRLLLEIQPNIIIQAQMDTVSQTVKWLKTNETDLIFLDIHLADDLCFKIFEQVDVKTPIIFATAYDKYMLQAFEVNSVYYLLKPIEKIKLEQALKKYHEIHQPAILPDFTDLMKEMQQERNYKKRFLLTTESHQLKPIKVEDIAYFEGKDKLTFVVTKNKQRYIIDKKLKELDEYLLNPRRFFRINRSLIVHIDAISTINYFTKSRIIPVLNPPSDRSCVVSARKREAFKAWIEL